MRLIVIVPFLNEADLLPRLLASIEHQTPLPIGSCSSMTASSDGSVELAAAFAARHPYVLALRRPPRGIERDRLAGAAELRSFTWALAQLDEPWDVVAKLDADLDLNPRHFEVVVETMQGDAGLGISSGCLSCPKSRRSVVSWIVRSSASG